MIKILVSIPFLGDTSSLIEPGILVSPDYLPKGFEASPKNIIMLAKALQKIDSKSDIILNFDCFRYIENLQIKEKVIFIVEELPLSVIKTRNLTRIHSVKNPEELYSQYLKLKEFCESYNREQTPTI